MNLNKLFPIQAELDNRIVKKFGLEGQDLLPKKILALQVELGELANEARFFKFWSEDQKPRTEKWSFCFMCNGGGITINKDWKDEHCKNCDGRGRCLSGINPLLEEYVDGLHFILSITLEIGLPQDHPYQTYEPDEGDTITSQFQRCFVNISDYVKDGDPYEIMQLITDFGTLGEMLGFTWEQIEQAYMSKNTENHNRQDRGY